MCKRERSQRNLNKIAPHDEVEEQMAPTGWGGNLPQFVQAQRRFIMRIRWRGLELPSRVVRDQQVSTDTYGKFTAEPFERGFGTTVGNSLRRILLSSLEGAAVTHVRLRGADHEFSSLPGVMEDVTDIILNVKSLIVKLDADEPKELNLTARKAGAVTAGMIEGDPSVTVINKDHVIATLTEDVTFDMTLSIDKGRGYV